MLQRFDGKSRVSGMNKGIRITVFQVWFICRARGCKPFKNAINSFKFVKFWSAKINLRHFRFDPSRMGTAAARPFEEGVRAVCGLQGGSTPNSLLSSLPCELSFNSLRDSSRRHAKQDKQSPAALHCVAWKSAVRHPCGSTAIDLQDQDWAEPVSQKHVKQVCHSALRCTDKELGLSCEGLTRHRINKVYTRPHVFCQRLCLVSTLSKVYSTSLGEEADRRADVLQLHSNLWISQLFGTGCFVREKPSGEGMESAVSQLLVVRGGPSTVLCVKLTSGEVGYSMPKSNEVFEEMVVDSIDSHEVAVTETKVHKGLAWTRQTGWMSLAIYVAKHAILEVKASILTSLCARMKVDGHAKLDHRHRVELFLRHMKCSEEYIESILSQLPERQKKQKKEDEVGRELFPGDA